LDPAKGAQPPQGLALVYLPFLPTAAEAGLSLRLLSFYLSPTMEQLLSQLAGKLAYLLLKAIWIPFPWTFFL
jgi:hypothetical protein